MIDMPPAPVSHDMDGHYRSGEDTFDTCAPSTIRIALGNEINAQSKAYYSAISGASAHHATIIPML